MKLILARDRSEKQKRVVLLQAPQEQILAGETILHGDGMIEAITVCDSFEYEDEIEIAKLVGATIPLDKVRAIVSLKEFDFQEG